MSRASLVFFLALWLPASVSIVLGQRADRASGGAANTVQSADIQTGYHGPVALGPFSIDNKVGGIGLHKMMSILRDPKAPKGMDVCYYDRSAKTYLVVERGADDLSLVRGLTLSRIDVCPAENISRASGFSMWATEKGIRLGSAAKHVLSKYGGPSSVWDMHNYRGFLPYPMDVNHSRMKSREHILVYLPRKDAPDTSHAFFGIRNGIVVWMTVSDNE